MKLADALKTRNLKSLNNWVDLMRFRHGMTYNDIKELFVDKFGFDDFEELMVELEEYSND